jgi:hypothetical protein
VLCDCFLRFAACARWLGCVPSVVGDAFVRAGCCPRSVPDARLLCAGDATGCLEVWAAETGGVPPEGTVTWSYKSTTDLYDLAKVRLPLMRRVSVLVSYVSGSAAVSCSCFSYFGTSPVLTWRSCVAQFTGLPVMCASSQLGVSRGIVAPARAGTRA